MPDTWKKRLTASAIVVATMVANAAAIIAYWKLADMPTTPEHLRNIILLAAGITAFAVSIWRARAANKQADATINQIKVTEQGQITERFTRAIEQLGKSSNELLFLRIGAIQALERIANDSHEDLPAVLRLLAGFARETSIAAWNEANGQLETTSLDITEAVASLSRLNNKNFEFLREREILINLSKAKFPSLQLPQANLAGFDLSQCNLSHANLVLTNLSCTNLTLTNFSYAMIWNTNFRGSYLLSADLSNANLNSADLSNAILSGSNLSNTYFYRANLSNASINDTDISSVILDQTNLSGTNIGNINRDRRTKKIQEGTTQQLSSIRYDKDNPPQNCPKGVELPPQRDPLPPMRPLSIQPRYNFYGVAGT